MKLTTHNTMTYQRPKQWWGKIFPFVARCQKVDYKKQHELGAEGFDLRIFWDKKGNIEYRHGLYRYSADNLYEVLDYARDNNIMIRILFELRTYNADKVKNADELRKRFKDLCKELEEKYPTIYFYCGRETGSWKQLYKFKNEENKNIIERYSSVTSLFVSRNNLLRIIDDWCPKLYARWMNRQNIEDYKSMDDNTYLMIDFINIQ